MNTPVFWQSPIFLVSLLTTGIVFAVTIICHKFKDLQREIKSLRRDIHFVDDEIKDVFQIIQAKASGWSNSSNSPFAKKSSDKTNQSN